METADRPRFAHALAVLAEVFGEPVSRARAEAYFAALSDLPVDAAEHALHEAVRHCRFFPKPAELRDLLPSTVPDASAAWLEVRAMLDAMGSCRRLPAIAALTREAVQRLGGWWTLQRSTQPGEMARRFEKIYDGLRRAEVLRTGDPRALPHTPRPALAHRTPGMARLADVLATVRPEGDA